MQISFKSVLIFVTIREKNGKRNWETAKNRNSHTSKIVCLLRVCLRNNKHPADHISEPYEKFYRKWQRIAYVIFLDRMKSIPKPKFASI